MNPIRTQNLALNVDKVIFNDLHILNRRQESNDPNNCDSICSGDDYCKTSCNLTMQFIKDNVDKIQNCSKSCIDDDKVKCSDKCIYDNLGLSSKEIDAIVIYSSYFTMCNTSKSKDDVVDCIAKKLDVEKSKVNQASDCNYNCTKTNSSDLKDFYSCSSNCVADIVAKVSENSSASESGKLGIPNQVTNSHGASTSNSKLDGPSKMLALSYICFFVVSLITLY